MLLFKLAGFRAFASGTQSDHAFEIAQFHVAQPHNDEHKQDFDVQIAVAKRIHLKSQQYARDQGE